mgnify:CR=1 FL=1
MTTNIATATIFIPTALRGFAGCNPSYGVPATTVGQALAQLTAEYPDLKQHLFSDEGKLRSFVNVFVGEEDIRYLRGTETPVEEGARLLIIPSIAGGS